MSVYFLFIDGIGLGEATSSNPFSEIAGDGWAALTNGQPMTHEADYIYKGEHLFHSIDARLGVEGLPQSGTGQASLFSGENASAIIDRHFGPFPHSETRHLLREESLFKKVQQLGKTPYFMNGYPEIFFKRMQKRNRWTCTTLMAHSSGQSLNRPKDVMSGRAVTAELTQKAWRERLNIDLPKIDPADAADRVLDMGSEKDLVLVEYYLTDKAGHAQDPDRAVAYLNILDGFIYQILKEMRSDDTLVVTSDHGNMEDLEVKTHTMNPVPLFAVGAKAKAFEKASSLLDVTPAILETLRE